MILQNKGSLSGLAQPVQIQTRQSGLKSGVVVDPGLKSGVAVGPKSSTDELHVHNT